MARNASRRSSKSKATKRNRAQGRLRRAFSSLLDSGAQALEALNGGRAPAYAPSRVRKTPLMMESLEPRQLLASDFYVNDNWVVVEDQGALGLDNGDTVDNSADVGATPVTGTFGTDAFDTITGALGPAIDGDTIHVLQGTYEEHVSITEDVTLLGAQAGVDARTRGAVPESIVDGTLTGAPFAISADGVVLDGFTITGGLNGGNAGVTIAPTSSGYDIKNNIITGNTIGIYANSDAAATIQRNLFNDNNLPGASGGAGIYSEATNGLVVDNNTFTNHEINNPMIFAATALGAHVDLAVTSNVFDNEFGIFALALDGATFANNEITTNDATALTIADGSTGVDIHNNDLSGNLRGVRIADFGFFGSSPISNVTAVGNDLSGNTEAGLVVLAGSVSDMVNASANWWGSATAAGVTAEIVTNGALVDYTPWLNIGTDSSAATGFQGDFSSLTVDDNSPQSGSTGRIQEGINHVNAGGLVIVLDGTYLENLTINKSLNLVGPNATLAGSDAGRGAKATILASAASDAMIEVTASGVEIAGFTIDGGDQVIRAIRVNEVNDVVARNNIITSAERGIQYNGAGGAGGHNTGGVVDGNLFKDLALTNNWGTETYGVVAFDSSYASVTNNVMTGLDVGVFEQYFYQPNGALNATNEISGNEITAAVLGYGTNERGEQAATTELSANTFTLTGGSGSAGVQLYNIFKANGITLVGNTITGADVGVYGFVSGGSASITGGSIDGNGGSIGVQLTNYLEGFTFAATGDGALSISGVNISDVDTGVLVEDDPLGAFGVHAVVTGDTDITATNTGIMIRGADASALVSGNDNSINGNGVGIDVDGGTAAVADNHIYNNALGIRVGDGGTVSIDNNEFDGGTSPDNTIDVQILSDAGPVVIGPNNHFAGNTYFIDNQSTQSYDLSSNSTTFDETDNFRREDKIHHRMDEDLPVTNGLVTWVAGNLYVTKPELGSTDSSIQRGVDVASSGDTVNVEAGTYTEQVDITKAITLAGEGTATVIKSPASLSSTFSVGSTNFFPVVTVEGVNATVRDLTIDGDGHGAANDQFVGLAYYNAGGIADNLTVTGVRHSPLDGVQNGLAIYARVSDATPRSLTISDSTVEDYQKNGITVAGADLSVEVAGNTITGAGDTPLIGQNGIQVSDGAVADIHNNVILGHQYSGVFGGPNFLTDTQSTGVLLFQAGAGTIVDDNDIDGNDVGVYSWSSGITIINNRLGLSTVNRYEGIVVDEGSTDVLGNTIEGGNVGVLVVSFGGSSLDSEANIVGNDITGAGIGIQAVDDDTLDGVQPVIVSALNTIVDSTTAGMLLADARSVVGAGDIESSEPGAVGIEVSGGAARIELMDLSGNHVGLRVLNDALVDAGDDSDSDITGLGSSAGNNDFTGYTGVGGNYAIENLNLVASGDLDVLAQNNDFGPFVVESFIENVIYDDTDDPTRTEVIFSPAQNQQTAPDTVYADDDWAGTALGDDPDTGDAIPMQFGVDAFAVIQDGVNAVAISGEVIVFAGTYEEQVVITKSLTLDGSGDTTIIRPDESQLTSLYNTGVQAGAFFNNINLASIIQVSGVGAAGVTIRDLTVDGSDVDALPAGASQVAGIVFGETAGLIDNVTVENMDSVPLATRTHGIWLNAVGGSPVAVEVADSTVSLYNRNGIVARGNELTVDIHDSTINGPGTINAVQVPNGILLIDTAGGTIADNTISALHHTGSPSLSGGVLLFQARDGIVVSGNEILDTDDAVLIAGTDLATVSGNNLHNNFKGVQIEATSSNNNILNNLIQNNTFGIFANATAGLGNTITNNDFEGATDNVTDVHLETAGAVLVGSNNQFGGDTFFIENLTTQDINLVGTGSTFDEANNFRIEDKMHHRVDIDLPLTNGLITWVADNLFVTTPGGLSTDSSIQRGIDAASPGDTVNVEAGTYSELLTIGKDINLVGSVDGLGNATTNLQPPSAGDLITINGSAFGDDETVRIENFNFNGLAGLADRGIHLLETADFDTLSVDNASFTGFDFNAIIVNGPVTGSLLDKVEISDSTFTNNGIAGGGGSGDLQFFRYNGDATLSDLVLVGSSVGTTGPRLGIQFRGTGDAAGVGTQPMGNVTLDNIDVSGDYVTQMIGIQRYSDVNNLSLNDVKLGGATSSITGTFGASLRLDAVGAGTLTSPATVNLGNTHFRGLDPASAIPFEIEIAPDNNHTFLRANATGTTWTVGGVDVAALVLTLPQAFDVEDRILHYVDGVFHPMGAAKGFVEVQDGKAFVSDTHVGSIRRGVEAVDANGTVHVSAGTFTESVLVDKTVTLLGAQAGVNAAGRVASESIITPAVGDEALALVNITAPNVTIDGFTIDGDGPVAGGVLLLDGLTQSNAARGIVVDADNAQVLNNRVMNTYRRGVQFWVNAASAPIGGLVNRNELSVIGAAVASPANSGDAILAFSDPTVTNNKVVTARTGITFIQVYAPNLTPITISGNEIDAINGIALNETSSSLPAITISGNTVATGDGGVGLLLWSVGGDLNATGNTFTGSGNGDIGVYGWTGTSTIPMNLTLTGGSITGYETGVHLTNDEATFGPALADTTVTLDGVSISGGDTGVLVEDAGASGFAVNLGLTGNTAIAGTVTGIILDGASAKVVGDTFDDTEFSGQSGDYIRLANGAYGAPGVHTDIIDATAVTFNGLLASAMTSAQRVALEGKIFHEPDDATLGFVRVDAVNDNPVADDDSATVDEDSINNAIDVLVNDDDVDGDTLTITGVTDGANGSVTFTATGVFYTPDPDFFGSDSFTYTISDGNGGTDTATVNVTVTPVNDDPVATDDSATVNEDSTNNAIDVLANDNDGVDTGELLTVTAVTQGVNGTVTFTPTGVFYTPDPDFFGSDSFTYTISDGNGGTDTATVNVTVIQVGPSFLGTNGNDTYLVRLDATGTTIEVYNSDPASGTPIYTTPLAGASELTFDTLAGDDRLIIDLINGNPIPANDITLIAGANGGAGDKLEIRGAGTGSGSFAASATEVGAGLVTLGGREIDLSGVEAIDAASLDSFAAVTPNAADTLSVEILADGTNVLSGTSGAINLPTVTLGDLNQVVIHAAANDAGGGDDALTVDSSSSAIDLPFIEFNSGTGTNTLTVEGQTSRIDATMSSGGSLATVVAEDATLYTHRFRQSSLTLSEGSRAIVLPDGTNTGASVLETLDIASSLSGPTAQLDLNDNDLILRATAATSDALHAAIEVNIVSGQNGLDSNLLTNWGGQGITSSTARTSNLATGFDLVGLGVIRNSDLTIATGLPHSPYTTFDGQPVGPNDVLVKFTYLGDGNFDGQTDFDDYAAMDNAFFGLIPNLGWATGDINYDDVINFDDYSKVDQAFYFQGAPLSGGGPVNVTVVNLDSQSENGAEEVFALLGAVESSSSATVAPAPTRFAAASSRGAVADEVVNAIRTARETAQPRSTAVRDAVLATLDKVFDSNENSALEKKSSRSGRFWRVFQ